MAFAWNCVDHGGVCWIRVLSASFPADAVDAILRRRFLLLPEDSTELRSWIGIDFQRDRSNEWLPPAVVYHAGDAFAIYIAAANYSWVCCGGAFRLHRKHLLLNTAPALVIRRGAVYVVRAGNLCDKLLHADHV